MFNDIMGLGHHLKGLTSGQSNFQVSRANAAAMVGTAMHMLGNYASNSMHLHFPKKMKVFTSAGCLETNTYVNLGLQEGKDKSG